MIVRRSRQAGELEALKVAIANAMEAPATAQTPQMTELLKQVRARPLTILHLSHPSVLPDP